MNQVVIDGLVMHPATGTLATLDASQRMPVSVATIEPTLPYMRGIQILRPMHLTHAREYALAVAWSLHSFYPPAGVRPRPGVLIGGLISYINCFLPPDMVEGQGALTEALNYSNLAPEWRTMTPENIQEFVTPEVLNFLRMFTPSGQQLFLHEVNQQIGLLGLLLLLIGKTVTTAGYDGWVNNRLRTFRGVLGEMEDEFIWVVKTTPIQRVLATLSTFMSANQPLRTRLFHVCLRASTSPTNIIAQVFGTVLRLLRGVEMNHIMLIDYYLFTKYPEILRIRAVRENMARFNQALAYLTSQPEEDRMYIKLIKPKADTAILNRNNFIMLSAAAYAAAKFENPSMKNYKGGQETAAGGYIDKIITSYLTLRTTTAISNMIRSPFSYLTRDEMITMEREANTTTRGIPALTNITLGTDHLTELPPMHLGETGPGQPQTATPSRH